MEKYCPNCNKPNPAEALFCRNCAVSLTIKGGGQPAGAGAGAGAGQPNYPNQQWNPQPQGYPMAGNYMQQPSAGPSGRAMASVALTICGLVLCCGGFTAIPGAILGWLEIGAIREGRSSPQGMMMAQIGLWGGIIVTIVMTILSFLGLFMMMLV
jgi:hypothetical protein